MLLKFKDILWFCFPLQGDKGEHGLQGDKGGKGQKVLWFDYVVGLIYIIPANYKIFVL